MRQLIENVLRRSPTLKPVLQGPSRFVFRCGGFGPADTLQVVVWSQAAEPVAVAKVAHGSAGHTSLLREWNRLRSLSDTLSEHLSPSIPQPLAFDRSGEHTILVESHLPGRRLKDLSRGWVGWQPEGLDHAVQWLIDLTQEIGPRYVAASGPDFSDLIGNEIESYRAAFEVTVEEDKLLDQLSERLVEVLGPEVPLVAAHGDFSDANILVTGTSIGVIDWEGSRDWTLPGADLFYLFCSLVATKHGLGRRGAFEKAFTEGFFSNNRTSSTFGRAWARYCAALDLPVEAGYPLFAAGWILFATDKLRYLGKLFDEPQTNYPVIFFADDSCLNVSLTASHSNDFALHVSC